MKEHKMSAYYFPTTAVFVDDQQKYLKGLDLKLDHEKFIPQFFYDPNKALDFLQNYQADSLLQRCILRPEEDQFDHRHLEIDIPAIRNEIYNPKRFTEISVIVVDYAMPGLNGLELCERLRNKPFKKLMLTGEADESLAVKAFNEGVIDQFIQKDSPHFAKLINDAIHQLQQKYFQELSNVVINSLTVNSEDPEIISCLNDPVFIRFFDEICQKRKVAEYYLTDAFGSYLFLDCNGQPSWLAVKDEDGMNSTFVLAECADTKFPPKLLAELEAKKKILYLYEGGYTDNPEEVKKYTYPAQQLQGKATYYYALIDDPDAYAIERDRIVSYKDFFAKASKNNL